MILQTKCYECGRIFQHPPEYPDIVCPDCLEDEEDEKEEME